ncbi:MAG: hypothetical protein J0I12_32655 [Candidatus Eremiobacteraeota bacterium]|nr:hypothetical protein [Candidatus Eremiobacteraeota bacterium]
MSKAVLMLGLWLGVAGLAGYLKPEYVKLNPVKPMVRYQDVLLDLLGEGRTMLARYLWFKMDTMHEEQDDQKVATFKQKEVVPLLRMINYLDPYLTDAYDTLSYELYYGYHKLDNAIELIEEGLRYSPKAYDLNFRRAFYAEKQKDYMTSFDYARRALEADQDETHNLAALRTMYRATVQAHDPRTGMQVVDRLTALIGRNPYPDQYRRWKEEMKS